MESEAAGHPLSLPLKDTYGRDMGEIVGMIFNLDGGIESIGVRESAGRFTIYPGVRLVRRESEILVIPDWRAEAQNLARQKESLAKRKRAIEELARSHDLEPKVYEEVSAQIEAARAGHERLREKVETRLRELETRHQSVSDFVGIAKIQHVTAEIDKWAYAVTAEFGSMELRTDEKELDELRSALGFLEDIEADAPPAAEPAESPQEGVPPALFDLLPEESIPNRFPTLTAAI